MIKQIQCAVCSGYRAYDSDFRIVRAPEDTCSCGVLSRDEAAEHNEEMLFLDGFDNCLVGVMHRFGQPPVALYDQAKIIHTIMEMGATYEETIEHFDYNIIGAYLGENTPAFATFAPFD